MKRLKAFRARSRTEQRRFVSAVICVSGVRVGMLLPFRIAARAVLRVPRRKAPTNPGEKATISWAVARANRFVPGRGACLHEALAAHVLLRRNGFSPELKIGVRRDEEGEFRAHAWIEEDGEVVIGGTRAEVTSYVVLDDWERIAKAL